MLENTQRIRLDICDNQTYEQIYTKQYNKGFPIEFEITKNGKPFDLSGIVAVMELKKPDDKIVVEFGNIDGNIVSVNIEDYMTTTDGKAKLQITLFDAASYDPDNKDSATIISTVTCTMKIDKSTIQNEDIEASKDVFNIVTEVLIGIEETKIASQNAKEYMEKSLEYSNNSKESSESSAISESNAKMSEENSKMSEDNSKQSELNAKESEQSSSNYALLSKSWAIGQTGIEVRTDEDTNCSKYFSEQSSLFADASKTSEDNAKISQENAYAYATLAQKYAVADLDSAKYYYEQAKRYYEQSKEIAEGLEGGLQPHGALSFEELPALIDVGNGWMYNITNDFTTTSEFKEGEGHVIPLGSNIFKTSDGFWDVLAGSPVVGIKGNAELTYRRGYVNITAGNIGFEIVSDREPSDQEVGCYWLEDYE